MQETIYAKNDDEILGLIINRYITKTLAGKESVSERVQSFLFNHNIPKQVIDFNLAVEMCREAIVETRRNENLGSAIMRIR